MKAEKNSQMRKEPRVEKSPKKLKLGARDIIQEARQEQQ